jgi:hypothetical protein
MHLFDKDDDDIEYSHLQTFVDCICHTFLCVAAITIIWAGSKLVGGSEL